MTMTLQTLAVACIVGACLAYAVWTLMPAAARRRGAAALLAVPWWPAAIAARLRKAAQRASSGCGCDGCDASSAPPTARGVRPVTFHPRPRR